MIITFSSNPRTRPSNSAITSRDRSGRMTLLLNDPSISLLHTRPVILGNRRRRLRISPTISIMDRTPAWGKSCFCKPKSAARKSDMSRVSMLIARPGLFLATSPLGVGENPTTSQIFDLERVKSLRRRISFQSFPTTPAFSAIDAANLGRLHVPVSFRRTRAKHRPSKPHIIFSDVEANRFRPPRTFFAH